VRFATFNLENLFARPKVFKLETWSLGAPILKAYADFNALIENLTYAQHARYGPAAVALVYPVVLRDGQQLPAPYRVTGFAKAVQLLFLDVGHKAPGNLEAFRATLLESVDDMSLTLVA
jgi:hypothetical protein